MNKQTPQAQEFQRSNLVEGTCSEIFERYARLAQTAQTADFGELDRDIVIIDTETTGLSLNHDELIQIAAARLERGQVTGEFMTFVNPGQPIPEDISHLTGIYDADVADAPDPEEALEALVGFVGGSDLVAHNADFDRGFVTKNIFGAPLLGNDWIDSLDLARIALPRLKSHRLIDLVHAFGAPVSTHRADADVEALCAVYRILLAAVAAMPKPLVKVISEMATEDEWPTVKVFRCLAAQNAVAAESAAAAREQAAAAHGGKSVPGSISPGLDAETGVAPAPSGQAEVAPGGQAAQVGDALGGGVAPVPSGQAGVTAGGNVSVAPATGVDVSVTLAPGAETGVAPAPSGQAEVAPGADALAVPGMEGFSLRSLRRRRTRELVASPRPDADDIAERGGLVFPDAEALAAAFRPDGLIGGLYANYEARAEQAAMAEKVRKAFASSTNLAIEAGTGVGKSMAYLLPAVWTAQRNNITVGIATKTNALLDQLVYKELPLLVAAIAAQAQPASSDAAKETSSVGGSTEAAADAMATAGPAAMLDSQDANPETFCTGKTESAADAMAEASGETSDPQDAKRTTVSEIRDPQDAARMAVSEIPESHTTTSVLDANVRTAGTVSETRDPQDAARVAVSETRESHIATSAASATSNETPLGAETPPGRGISFASLKGFSHYPCLRKIERIVREGPKMWPVAGDPVSQAPALAALVSFVEQSEYDDIDTLKIDYRTLPRYMITSTSAECLRRRCPFYGTPCFVHGSRRRAEASDIVVANHSLLFRDIATEGGLLPPIRYWVIDEAHGAEAEARSAFSLEFSAEETLRQSRRLASDEASQSPFVRARRRLWATAPAATGVAAYTPAPAAIPATAATAYVRAPAATLSAIASPASPTAAIPSASLASPSSDPDAALPESVLAQACQAAKDFDAAAADFAAQVKGLSFFAPGRRNKGYEVVELWVNDDIRASEAFARLAASGRAFCEAASRLAAVGQEAVGALEGVDAAAEDQREIASAVLWLKDTLAAVEAFLFPASDSYAFSATFSSKSDRVAEKLQSLLLNVGERLDETLFANTHSVVLTSATLTVADSFEAFEGALGLNASEPSRAEAHQLSSSYDFDAQMTIYVADDVPEPNDPAYLPALCELLVAVHLAQHGSMLTLFTNRKEMEKCFDVVQPALKAAGLRLVCQKWGVSAKGLRDDFLQDESLSLFALKSFWEGFDAPGATLKGVVIPKLPFTRPTDPLSCERALRDPGAWSRFVLPAAVLETKQAVGRLIRSSADSGCIVFADRRLVSKGYGKTFLRSMPSHTIKVCPTAVIARELAAPPALPVSPAPIR